MDLDIKQHFFGSFGFESRAGELQKSSALHPLACSACCSFKLLLNISACMQPRSCRAADWALCVQKGECTRRLQLTTVLALQCCCVGVFHVTCVPCNASVSQVSFTSI